MSAGPLREKIRSRVAFDMDEGDIAYYYALLFEIEYITKIVVSGVMSCLGDDADRNRYSLEYALVRANGIGEWVGVLQSTLTGPSAQFFRPQTLHVTRDLTERVQEGDWRFSVVKRISTIAERLGLPAKIGNKVALRQFFEFFVAVRNRTRGHGAITTETCNEICPILNEVIILLWDNCEIFKCDWVHLYQNLTGKYRVSPMMGEGLQFEHLKRSKDILLPGGVYIYIDGFHCVPLVFSGPGVEDIFLPNGNFKSDEFEVLSLITDEVSRKSGSAWSSPPGRLPASHTEGNEKLDQLGNTFTNLPDLARGHIKREELEKLLREQLLKLERHPIITLTGPGGIGKTTLTLVVVESLAKSEECPYDVVLWMSSRDVDLLDNGPKPVRPKVVTKESISRSIVELMEPPEYRQKGFEPQKFFERCLAEGAAGKTLFILDNFETVEDPVEIFRWVDTHLRHPNKVLITTRFREFHGDFPIEITGMSDSEARQLVVQEARRLGISDIVSDAYTQKLIDESDGHPYVIKILLGQVAKEGRAVTPERIIAGADQLLLALFERTYAGLSPSGQRIFLLLSSWRAFVPSIAVEAVALRPDNERFNVSGAIDELRRYSLVEEVVNKEEEQAFIGVPLAAASFGRRKLEVSPFKVAVELDRKLLMEFGAGSRDSSRHGVMPRIDRLVAAAASRASEDPGALESFLPVLEYLGTRVPKAFLRVATLLSEQKNPDNSRVKSYIRRYLESSEAAEKEYAWYWLADICHADDDPVGEVHALSEVAMLPMATPETFGVVANRINNNLKELKGRGVEKSWSNEVQQLIERVAEEMRRHIFDLDATNCSKLAWLYLNIGNQDLAYDIAKQGLSKDLGDEHCVRLIERLER
ncbi:NB-ARC domain-containing protein [Isoalcanivorax indicus]|uniref:NB-ARC domain-containing protein n=1 Tax=Isoalcanivorax indicus TaxID=2202653 RepID=UPI0013C4E2B0|nr:NB-ARC domain-containing protein [Isoalcanivorax indicus]